MNDSHARPTFQAFLSLVCVVLLWAPVGITAEPADMLNYRTRAMFIKNHSPSHVEVYRIRAPDKHQSRHFHPDVGYRAVLLRSGAGNVVLTPSAPFVGETHVRIKFPDGKDLVPAELRWSDQVTQDAALFVEARPTDAEQQRGFDALPALRWSTRTTDALTQGLQAWVIERPIGLGLRGAQASAILVDTRFEARPKAPLARFPIVPLRRSTGLALLDARGDVLCVVFRPWGPDQEQGLCAGADWLDLVSGSELKP